MSFKNLKERFMSESSDEHVEATRHNALDSVDAVLETIDSLTEKYMIDETDVTMLRTCIRMLSDDSQLYGATLCRERIIKLVDDAEVFL